MFLRNLVLGLMALFIAMPANAHLQSTYYLEVADHPVQRPLIATATGIINSVDPTEGTVNISHTPIAAFGWPAMTMDFPVPYAFDFSKIKTGDHVSFTIERSADDQYTVTTITPGTNNNGGGQK